MPSKKQSRRSISVRKGTYEHLQAVGARLNVSISDYLEGLIKADAEARGWPAPPPALPGVHKPAPKLATKLIARARAEALGVVQPAVREMPPAPPPVTDRIHARRSDILHVQLDDSIPVGQLLHGEGVAIVPRAAKHAEAPPASVDPAPPAPAVNVVLPVREACAPTAPRPAPPVVDAPTLPPDSSVRWMTAKELARVLNVPPIQVRRALDGLETQQRVIGDGDEYRATELAILDVRNGTIRPIDNASRVLYQLAQPVRAEQPTPPAIVPLASAQPLAPVVVPQMAYRTPEASDHVAPLVAPEAVVAPVPARPPTRDAAPSPAASVMKPRPESEVIDDATRASRASARKWMF